MSQLSDDELKKLVESNARAIEALANTMAENERKSQEEKAQAREERARVRKEMAELRETVASAIENLSNTVSFVAKAQGENIAGMYRTINRVETRQGEIVDVLKLLSQKVVGDKNED